MRKSVTLGSKSVELECNAAVPHFCKRTFGFNPIKIFSEMENMDDADKVEVLEKIGFIMAMAATKKLEEMHVLTEMDFERWLLGFEWDDIASEEFVSAVGDCWVSNNKQESQPKN